MATRPAVVRLFYKNGHNYRKDYGVEVHTLGRQIKEWWAEIYPPNGSPSIQFGGPTGIYSLVVLVLWWCRLLGAKPDEERVDCLRALEDIDRAFVAAIEDIERRPTSTSTLLSPTPPPPSSQPRKRAGSEGRLPQKRVRCE